MGRAAPSVRQYLDRDDRAPRPRIGPHVGLRGAPNTGCLSLGRKDRRRMPIGDESARCGDESRQGGRHAAPTGAARRAAGRGPNRTQEPGRPRRAARGPAGAGPGEQIAIIGGSAITVLAGRIRRRHTSADVESPTTELSLTLPTPRVDAAATDPAAARSRPAPAAPVPAPAEPTDPGDPAAPAPTDPGLVDRSRSARRPRPATSRAAGRSGSPASRRARPPRVPGDRRHGRDAGAGGRARRGAARFPDRTRPRRPGRADRAEQAAAPSRRQPVDHAVDPDRATAYLDGPARRRRPGQPQWPAGDRGRGRDLRAVPPGVPDAELARVLPAMLTDRRPAAGPHRRRAGPAVLLLIPAA